MELGRVFQRGWSTLAVCAIAAVIVALLLGQTPSRASTAPLSISISGNHFVDGAGRTIRLLGVNVTSSEYACVDGYGYDQGDYTDATAAAIASWGANAVRVPLNEDCWLGINGEPSDAEGQALTQAGYQHEIEQFVADLNAHGLYAILDLHWTAPGNQSALEQQPMPDLDHSPAFWTSVATAFKSNPAVVFDLFNEPYDPTDTRSGGDGNASDAVTWDCWASGTKPDPIGGGAPPIPCSTQAYDDAGSPTTRYQIVGMQTLLSDIRSVGATQPVLVGGLNYSNDLSQWADNAPNDPLNQEAASFHNYQGQVCDTQACWDSTIASVAKYVPVVTGEFGQDNYDESTCTSSASRTYDDDFMKWADTAGVSYLAWGWLVETPSELSSDGCSAYVLISNYNGTPAPPNGTALHDHLQALAAGGGGGPGGHGTLPPVQLLTFKASVSRAGTKLALQLRAAQTGTGSVTGQSVSRKHRVSLGTAGFKLSAGKTKLIVIKLSAASRKLLAKRHSLKVRFTITLTAAGHRQTIVQRSTTLRTPRRKHH